MVFAASVAVALAQKWDMPVSANTPVPNMATRAARAPALGVEGTLPDLAPLTAAEKTSWLNSPPLSRASLHGKVVIVDFWTYSCINSLRNIPYLRSWAQKYKDAGLVVVGAHTPEFGFEKDLPNIERAVREYGVEYPVAVDSEYGIWDAFGNMYWPADYFIDRTGRIRYHHYGEGDYDTSERVIQELLRENGGSDAARAGVRLSAPGAEAPPSDTIASPETYVGYRQAERFASPERVQQDRRASYSVPARLALNNWGLAGQWNVGGESGVLAEAPGKIAFRFHSRDLHLVMGPNASGSAVRFTVKLDGAAPGRDHGVDTAPDGGGVVREPRMYQLIRQTGAVRDRTFEIEFLDPGAHAYSFTFG
ncbi:MAG: redoxin domain-containing protein [Elusimicrobia bacterium]|nr:redoxin domain-containing protein [Elusimicrobiota bacterium]